MADFEYVVELLEAKGWYLYESAPNANLPQVISAGRARVLRPGVYDHLCPPQPTRPPSRRCALPSPTLCAPTVHPRTAMGSIRGASTASIFPPANLQSR